MPRERRRQPEGKRPPGGRRSSKGVLILSIIVVFLTGLLVRILFFPGQVPGRTAPVAVTAPAGKEPLESSVLLVSAEFRCACGGCGELPLVDCECDMPRGAIEEKGFIRKKLAEGMSVDQVIQLMEKTYGHRMA